MARFGTVDAVSLDLFNTLIYHREGRGRGHALIAYLTEHGFRPRPWEHRLLYEILELHADRYSPDAGPEARDAYFQLLTRRTFERLHISAAPDQVDMHSEAIWRILGPDCFGLFPEVMETLEDLKRGGYPLVLISNWQSGVAHYCTELGLAPFFDHMLGSADLDVAKPDPRIFNEAASRLGVEPARIVHVGDTWGDDYLGGQAAGFQVCLIDRDAADSNGASNVIGSLAELLPLLAPDGRSLREK